MLLLISLFLNEYKERAKKGLSNSTVISKEEI